MRAIIWMFGLACFVALSLLAVAVWRGDRSFGVVDLWERLAGPADLGPVDFGAIRRSATDNDALFCPAGLCGATRSEGAAPVFAVPAVALQQAVRAYLATEPDLVRVASDDAAMQDRYVARTARMRFPDTVHIRIVPMGEGRSTLALYSRSQIGRKDFGVNRARLEGWLAGLGRSVPTVSP
ncbi:MAG: DUF1499 domain-containing protein [Beijerinckiaceae bacterium]|nr:DUF1499 domain-containing protein [Beijerinckiaceae bacterium]